MTRDLHLSRALEQLEQRQREEAPAVNAPIRRETARVRIPEGGVLPRSEALLERLYHGELVPREKKPQVIDTRRCCGPYLVSIDEAPMVLLDACSQIATLTHGFAHPAMLRGLYEGRFDACLWANPDSTVVASPELDAYAELLIAKAPAGLAHASFVGAGGAEANEKALRLARLHGFDAAGRAGRTRVLAFDGSFHGRTLITLGATSNPAKRKGVVLPGFEAVFCPRDLGALRELLDARAGEFYAVIVEPMMAEGGDVHLSREFLLAVRQATRERGLPLIVDEVQTGFGTGGSFFWWSRLGLGEDPELAPDVLTCAKKAGLGAVISRWSDPEPTAVNVASGLRGLIHGEHAEEQAELEGPIRLHLQALVAAHPTLVSNPRLAGSAFAFDLPSAADREAFINQRFARGFMTYHAGDVTIRFRLAAGWEQRHLQDLFARIDATLRRLHDPEAGHYAREGGTRLRTRRIDIREVGESDWAEVMAIEQQAYEAERADSEEYLRDAARNGVGLIARDSETDEILGFAFGAPLEHFPDLVGPAQDPHRGNGRGFYAADLTVAESARGRGIGRQLKRAQLEWARGYGFDFVTGRNKIGATDEMSGLNRSVGAYTAQVFDGQYDGKSKAEYYRVPLGVPQVEVGFGVAGVHDLASGLQAPFGVAPAFMARRELVGPTVSRLNLSNYATIDTVHYTEHLRLLAPRGTGHMYFTSSRDELVDKSLRCLRLSRPDAQLAVGLEGGYVGHVTAAARSLSDAAGFADGFALFDWPRLPHPSEGGVAATIAALDALVDRVGGGALFGLYVELVGERSGL
ncbi:MAG: aminotransferase class III-fold pyridoxal phosphate-dependent enzyme, partial [Myxococcales bacterium]|nr:aminotransferase class III-fold pyridoxal phosphate-dependent enzyme [Myxococcales bacterium]